MDPTEPSVLRGLLGPALNVAETWREESRPMPAAYEPFVSQAGERRRSDFAAGRWCAERALAEAGHPAAVVAISEGGAPVWPEGVVGSITHCPGYAAAVVASAQAVRTVGIDAEVLRPLPEGVAERVCSPQELSALPRDTAVWPVVAFSAKEAAINAWRPPACAPPLLRAVLLELDTDCRRFRVRLLDTGDAVDGVFALTQLHVVTAVVVER